MHCMKCGRKIEDQKVFCADCLTDMEKFPVKPDSTVYIPVRPTVPAAKKKSRRTRELRPEEQLRQLKLTVRGLSIALVVCIVAFAISTGIMLKLLSDQSNNNSIGQNYTTIGQTD